MTHWLERLESLVPEDELIRIKKVDEMGEEPLKYLYEIEGLDKNIIALELSKFWNVPYLELVNYHPDEDAINKLSEELARRFGVFPLFQLKSSLYIAIANPEDILALDYLHQLTGLTIEPVLATTVDIEASINKYYLSKEKAAKEMEAYSEKEEELGSGYEDAGILENKQAPVIKLLNYIMSQAINLGASDIHLEPYESSASLRYRIDGVLHGFPPPPFHLFKALVARLKVISNLDIAERRMPQDGRSSFVVDNKEYDLRVSIIPNLFGEGVVVRILDTKGKNINLEDLGFSREILEKYDRIISNPYGIFLVTGPTGSGKSTTLYATLKKIYTPVKKIITLEDPVEYQLPGVTQIQINSDIGYTFGLGLRAVLRHDPDIIMLGEIRDLDTAEIAIRSSLTGHLVFSTLHTNDAPSSVTRLIDMGIKPFLVFGSLIGIMAQRLVRKLCPQCKKPIEEIPSILKSEIENFPENFKLFEPVGCSACKNLGYQGRTVIFELLQVTPKMRNLKPEDITPENIKEIAKEQNFKSLRDSAIDKLFAGETSIEEVISYIIS